MRQRLPRSGEPRPSAIASSGCRLLFLYSLLPSPAFRPCSRAGSVPPAPSGIASGRWLIWGEEMPYPRLGLCPKEVG